MENKTAKNIIRQLASPTNAHQTPTGIAFYWLLLLRWGAVACQIVLIGAVYFILQIDIPLAIISFIIAFEVGSNIFFAFLQQRKRFPDWLFILVMFLDVSLLSLLIYYTGGPMNPFTFLYLVHTVVAAIVMRPRGAWSLAAFTIFCYALLFYVPIYVGGSAQPVCHTPPPQPGNLDTLSIHLQGMWLAFAMTSCFIVFFVSKIQQSLENYQSTILDLKEEKNKSEKLVSLATLAAGAAHEFATPLSTIAVAAGEMHHFLTNNKGDTDLIDDTRLIKDQIDKCKDILYQMSADAGEPMGEPPTPILIGELLAELVYQYGENKLGIDTNINDMTIKMPPRTIRRALRCLINNAVAASAMDARITLACDVDREKLYFRIIDQGLGMDRQTQQRAMEPFFTTKEAGKGLGLGLFLVRSVAERFGGGLKLVSKPGKGTTVTLSLALDRINGQ